MTFSIETQAPRYNTSAGDSRSLDHEETILGHLLTEKQYSLKDSLYYLTAYAKQETKSWDSTESVSSAGFWVGMVAGGAAFMAVGAGPIGMVLGGVVAAIGSGGSWLLKDTAERVGALRRTEFELHRNHPWIRDRLWQLSQTGATSAEIVAIYDRMLFHMFANGIPSDGNAIAGSMGIQSPTFADLPATASAETTAQSGIQTSSDPLAPRTESQALAVTELQAIAPGVAAAPSMQHIVSPVWNPAQDLGENPQSALIVGTPGSGKGMMVSNAVRVLKERNPDLTVFVVDPKADPKEKGYWTSIADTYRAFSLMNCSDPDDGAEWLLRCMDEFRKLPAPKLCIFDELMSASTELSLANKELKALQRLKKFVVGLIGQGDSTGVFLWAMTQSPQVNDLGMGGGVRANLRVIGLVSPKNLTAIEALTSTKLIPAPAGGMDELRSIMAASPVGRAVFDGKIARWLPMPKLMNHSGFDRDNRSLNDESSPPESRSPSPSVAQPSSEPEWKAYQEIPQQSSDEVTPKKETYDGWAEYPIHQAVLKYLSDKEGKTDRDIYDAIRRRRSDSEWESVPGTDNMSKLRTILKYLAYNRKIGATPEGVYSGIG